MDRRVFIGGVAGVIVAAPLVAEAQPAARVARIVLVTGGNLNGVGASIEAFRQGLRDLGYTEGRNVVIEYREAGGNSERLAALVAELVALKVDVIVASGTPTALAAKRATETVPIVIPFAGDPVASGLASSISRPGGNVTGLTNLVPDLVGKRLEQLKQAVPAVNRVTVLWQPGFYGERAEKDMLEGADVAAARLGMRIERVEARSSADLDKAVADATRVRAGALLVAGGALFNNEARRLVDLAARHRLPAMYPFRTYVDAGGLMSYGANQADMFRRAATYVDKILKGTKPADLPFEQPAKFELVINLKTARSLAITIPPAVLARADDVIQ